MMVVNQLAEDVDYRRIFVLYIECVRAAYPGYGAGKLRRYEYCGAFGFSPMSQRNQIARFCPRLGTQTSLPRVSGP